MASKHAPKFNQSPGAPVVGAPSGKPANMTAMPPGADPVQWAQFQAFQAAQVPTSAATGAGIVPTGPKAGMTHTVRKTNAKTGTVSEKTIPSLAAFQAFGPLTLEVRGPAGQSLATWTAEPDQNGSGSWGYGVNGSRLAFQTPGGPASLVVSVNLTQSDSKPTA